MDNPTKKSFASAVNLALLQTFLAPPSAEAYWDILTRNLDKYDRVVLRARFGLIKKLWENLFGSQPQEEMKYAFEIPCPGQESHKYLSRIYCLLQEFSEEFGWECTLVIDDAEKVDWLRITIFLNCAIVLRTKPLNLLE